MKVFIKLKTSPWLEKISKIIDLKHTEMKVMNNLKTSSWLKKILKIIDLKRTEMKGSDRLKFSPWLKKIMRTRADQSSKTHKKLRTSIGKRLQKMQ